MPMTFYATDSVKIPLSWQKFHVKQGKFGVGDTLVSDGFGPCIGMMAELKNDFVLYHAESPFATADGFQEMVAAIKGNVEDLYVFQKAQRISHVKKVPLMVVELSRELDVEAKRIETPFYSAIIIDSKNKRVVLAYKAEFAPVEELEFAGKILDVSHPIPLKQSVEDAVNFNQTAPVPILIPDDFFEATGVEPPKPTPKSTYEDRKALQSENEWKRFSIFNEKKPDAQREQLIKNIESKLKSIGTAYREKTKNKVDALKLCLDFLNGKTPAAEFSEKIKKINYSSKKKGVTFKLIGDVIKISEGSASRPSPR